MNDTQTAIKHRVDIRRTRVLQIRLRPLEYSDLAKKAEKMAITVAAYGRMAIKNYRRGA